MEKDSRPRYVVEAAEIGRMICVLESQRDLLKYNFDNASAQIQKELTRCWMRVGELDRMYGIKTSLSEVKGA